MYGLTNNYLEQTSKRLLGPSFVGVFPADGFSDVPRKKNFSIIFNTDVMKNPGKHFVAIHVTSDKVHYFDSFGNPNIQKNISDFIVKTKRKCFMHCEVIQDKSSNFCGYYALAFLIWMKTGRRSYGFYNLFNSNANLQKNDSLVTQFIIDEIK